MNGQNGASTPKVELTPEQLLKALHHVEDLFDQLMVPFFLLGETAHQVVNNDLLAGGSIIVGTRNLNVTDSVKSTIVTRLGIEIQPSGFNYIHEGVPVHVKFIKNRYDFFEFPDSKAYMYGSYNLPNPFESYWEQKNFIR